LSLTTNPLGALHAAPSHDRLIIGTFFVVRPSSFTEYPSSKIKNFWDRRSAERNLAAAQPFGDRIPRSWRQTGRFRPTHVSAAAGDTLPLRRLTFRTNAPRTGEAGWQSGGSGLIRIPKGRGDNDHRVVGSPPREGAACPSCGLTAESPTNSSAESRARRGRHSGPPGARQTIFDSSRFNSLSSCLGRV
jgi:hypothetical protein